MGKNISINLLETNQSFRKCIMGFEYILRNFTSLLFSLDAEDIIFPADASVTCLAGSIFTSVLQIIPHSGLK